MCFDWRLYRPARLLQQANLVNVFVLLDGVDILDHAFSSIVAGGYSRPQTLLLRPWPCEGGYVLITRQSIPVNLHPTRIFLRIRGAYLIQAEYLPRRVVKFVMINLVGSKGGVEWNLYI